MSRILFRVKIKGLPKDLPEVIHVDVTALEADHSLYVSDLKIPSDVEILASDTMTVITVASSRLDRVEEDETATGETEVEAEKEEKAS